MRGTVCYLVKEHDRTRLNLLVVSCKSPTLSKVLNEIFRQVTSEIKLMKKCLLQMVVTNDVKHRSGNWGTVNRGFRTQILDRDDSLLIDSVYYVRLLFFQRLLF